MTYSLSSLSLKAVFSETLRLIRYATQKCPVVVLLAFASEPLSEVKIPSGNRGIDAIQQTVVWEIGAILSIALIPAMLGALRTGEGSWLNIFRQGDKFWRILGVTILTLILIFVGLIPFFIGLISADLLHVPSLTWIGGGLSFLIFTGLLALWGQTRQYLPLIEP